MSFSELKNAWADAYGAYVDGRLDNLVFKHKQLYALFETLQLEGVKGWESGAGSSRLGALELEHTLRSISDALETLPHHVSAEFDREQKLKDVNGTGSRKRAVGVVVIVASQSHPFASWAVPLSQAIIDGNAALIFIPPGSRLVPTGLKRHVDSAAYQVHEVEQSKLGEALAAIPSSAGVVGLASALPKSIKSHTDRPFQLRPLFDGPVPIIVDQSILPRGIPLSPKAEAEGLTPYSVTVVAQHIAQSVSTRDNSRPSLGAPTYLLVHENVVEPLLRALTHTLPSELHTQLTPLFENKAKITKFINAQQGGAPSFLPVYSVRSIDMAIDFLQDDVTLPAVTYVFAEHRFAAYTFNSLKGVPAVHLNQIPESALALGPYAERDQLTINTTSYVSVVKKPTPHPSSVESSVEKIQRLKARKLVQNPGNRIDFFGGSFMFSGGLTASMILGGVGYGLYKGATLLWSLRSK